MLCCNRRNLVSAARWGAFAAAVLMIATGLQAGSPAKPDLSPPGNVDLRPVFANWGLEVSSQGKRNTCSVFAVAGALEYAMASQQRSGTRLSVEFLNWASNQAIREAVDGGYFSDLWKGYEAYGICTEEDCPYLPAFDPERRPSEEAIEHARQGRNTGLQLHWIKPWDVHTGLTESQFFDVKQTLRRQWPVCAGLRWPRRARWVEGVLQMAPPDGVYDGHSVLLVGFRDDAAEPGGGVFLFRNSSTGPRDGAMTYEYARAYMNDAAWIDHETAAVAAAEPGPRPSLASRHPGAASPEVKGNLAGLDWLLAAPRGRNRRVSSNQQPDWNSENLDMTWLMPGQSVNMPVLEGPGVITHIWMTSHAGWVGELNALSLRIYWDGAEEPGVEAPLGDFFAVGQGKPAVVESIPVQVSPSGSLSCYWRMPFRKSARIVVTNDNPDRSTGLYWQVDWVEVDQLPPETPYFYARFRREYPAAAGRDYQIADLEGRGMYVGTVLAVTLAQDGWFGEGDDFFYIDGEKTPSLQGTGSEDYFNDAWGFRQRTGPWFGQPRWEGDSAGDSGVCYRWHLVDPVYFNQSLKVAIEHKGNRLDDTEGFYLERPDFFSSVAFWYQEGRPKPFSQLPPWPERRVPWDCQHLVRVFLKARSTGSAKAAVQTTGFFGARPVLSWPNETPGEVLTLPFQTAQEGRFAVRLTAAVGPAYGPYEIKIDGKRAVSTNFRAQEDSEVSLSLGTHILAKGEHTISFHAGQTGDNPAGPLAVEMLRLLRLPAEANRAERTHNEAHFVRLGIGRAVYAYRLAYGKLPDSLETLVESGIMPARFLNDENNLPLRCRRDGDFFVVESPGPDRWTHRWQGLDARR